MQKTCKHGVAFEQVGENRWLTPCQQCVDWKGLAERLESLRMEKPKAAITLVNETRGEIRGLLMTAFVPFDGFRDEKEGAKYSVPVKARDAENKLAKDADGAQLYMLRDGGTTSAPFESDGRTVRPNVAIEAKQATPHIDFSKSITDENVVWPDGKIRTLKLDLKANNPMTADEYKASKAAATAKRATTSVTAKTDAELEAQLQAMQAELARRKAPKA